MCIKKYKVTKANHIALLKNLSPLFKNSEKIKDLYFIKQADKKAYFETVKSSIGLFRENLRKKNIPDFFEKFDQHIAFETKDNRKKALQKFRTIMVKHFLFDRLLNEYFCQHKLYKDKIYDESIKSLHDDVLFIGILRDKLLDSHGEKALLLTSNDDLCYSLVHKFKFISQQHRLNQYTISPHFSSHSQKVYNGFSYVISSDNETEVISYIDYSKQKIHLPLSYLNLNKATIEKTNNIHISNNALPLDYSVGYNRQKVWSCELNLNNKKHLVKGVIFSK